MKEIRLKNLISLSKNYSTQREFADAIGLAPSQLGHLLSGHRGIGEKLARKIESNLRISAMSLDVPQELIKTDENLLNELVKPVEITTEELGFLNILRDLSSVQRKKMREIAINLKSENKILFSELGSRYQDGNNHHAHV